MKNQFLHQFLPRIDLERIETDQGRFYKSPTGNLLPSVTNVIGEWKGTEHLDKWRNRIGQSQAAHITKTSSERGDTIHKLIEKLVLNQIVSLDKINSLDRETYLKFKKNLLEHVDNIRGVELRLYSDEYNAAGTTDLIGEYDNKLSIIDYKTSKRKKRIEWIDHYFVQSTCYAIMANALFDLNIENIVIVMSVDNEPFPDVFNEKVETWKPLVEKVFKKVAI